MFVCHTHKSNIFGWHCHFFKLLSGKAKFFCLRRYRDREHLMFTSRISKGGFYSFFIINNILN